MRKPGKISVVNGKPNYSADYDKLLEEYPPLELESEQTIPFEEISDVIAMSMEDKGFWSVVRGWINRLEKDYHVYAKKVEDGVLIMTEDQKYDKAERKFKSGIRSIVKAGTIARDVDHTALSPDRREKCLLLRKQAANAEMAAICKENFEFRLT